MNATDGKVQAPNFYKNAHLVVAAVRILEHQNQAPPSIDGICQALSFSVERGNHICRKLHELGVINVVDGAFGTRLFIKNHLLLENIPQGSDGPGLEEDLKKFREAKKDIEKEIEARHLAHKEKKKNLFAEIEDKLRKDLENR